MSINTQIQNLMEASEQARQAGHQGMRLGGVLKALEGVEDDLQVTFDFEYMAPGTICSYRGYYSDLAIGFNEGEAPKCGEFRDALRACVGKTFEGYKGGDYTMTEATPVWVANWGNTGGTAVVRVTHNSYEVILHTAKLD